MRNHPAQNSRESGFATIFWLGILSLVFVLIPMTGLVVDVGFIYAVRSKMQSAVDGAALGAARALSIGQSLASQTTSAQSNAVSWFNANFPSSYFGIASVNMSTSNVSVYADTNNAQLRHVQVSATAQVNTFFMRWFGVNTVTVGATGNASRRTVVAMLVLDRSGSMCQSGSSNSQPCDKSDTSLPCAAMIGAAKQFTGQFAQNSDYIGLISFSDNVYVHSLPTQSFQTTLGYSNSGGSANGALDNIVCTGGTSTAEGVSMAYQALQQMNLPGALNVIVLETDGLPNTLVMSFYDSANSTTALASNSSCKDGNSKTLTQGGFNTAAAIPSWAGGMSLQSSPFSTFSGPPSPPYTSIPTKAMVGAVYSSDPGQYNPGQFLLMLKYFTTTTSNNYNVTSALSGTGCNFDGGQWYTAIPDINWFPATDVFANALNPSYSYNSVTTDNKGHIVENGWQNYHNAVLNATDNAAYKARSDADIPITVMTIGLGGNSQYGPPDPILLQRMANDPNGDAFNQPATYSACAQESGCTTWSSQPQGTFVYSPNASNLGAAFLRISSQMLRLSK